MAGVDDSAFNAQANANSPVGTDAIGAISVPGVPGEVAPLSYEDQAGPVLDAFEQKQAAQGRLMQAAKDAQAATANHAAVVQQATGNAPQGGHLAPKAGGNAPQGAFTPPSLSLTDYLKQHGDDDFEAANQDAKRVHGKSADEMYDELQKQQYIQPADQDLTKRQKAEALMHIGLEIMSHSQSKNRWSQNPVGAFAAGGEAGLNDVQKDQQENQQQAANRAHEEYLKSQDIGLKRAGEEAQAEKEDTQQAGENARNAATTKRDLLVHQYDQEQQNARNAADLKERHQDRAVTKAGEGNLVADDQGNYVRVVGGKAIPVLGPDGKPVKAQRTAEDEAKAEAVRGAQADKLQQRREAHEKDWGASYDKAHPQIAGLEDPAAEAARQRAHDSEMSQWDSRNQAGGGAAKTAPNVGDVVKGYRFKGGDPGKQESWEQAGS